MTTIGQNPVFQRILQGLGAAAAIFIALVIATGILQILLVLLALGILLYFVLKLPFVQRYLRRKFEQNLQEMQRAYENRAAETEKDITVEVRVIEENTSNQNKPLE